MSSLFDRNVDPIKSQHGHKTCKGHLSQHANSEEQKFNKATQEVNSHRQSMVGLGGRISLEFVVLFRDENPILVGQPYVSPKYIQIRTIIGSNSTYTYTHI